MPQGPGTYEKGHPLNNPKHPAYADGVVTPQERNQANRNFAQRTGGQVYGGPNQQAPPPVDPWASSPIGQGAGVFGTGSSGQGQYQTANIYAGQDAATGKPYYIAGYGPDGQPQFSWSPTYNPAEHPTGLNRQIGHFQDAVTSGGQFDPSGFYLSNAQGSQYQFNPVTNALLQTGSYVGGQPPPVDDPAGQPPPGGNPNGTGGANVNPNLTGGNGQGGGFSSTGGPPGGGNANVKTGQESNVANMSGAAGGGVRRPGPNLGGMGGSSQAYNFGQVNQSGPFQGGLNNQAVYRSGNQPSRVPWQMRLTGGGGAANDVAGRSASRLF